MTLTVDVRDRVGALELEAAFSAAPGCLALAGPSGAGKSTLLRIAAGLRRPAHGTVTLGPETWLDTAAGVDRPPEARRCGVVFQDYALFPHLRAWENVAYGAGRGRAEGREHALALLDRFGLAGRAQARPADLSGGERQRGALARALARAGGRGVLLLDEPLSALDAATRATATGHLREALAASALPAVLVTHDFAEAALLADEIAVLDHGRIVQRGTAAMLASAPASAFVARFAGAIVLTGTARAVAGMTEVALDGGGTIAAADRGGGPVAAIVFPWEIGLEPPGAAPHGASARNRLHARVQSVTELGGRVRVGLDAGQPLSAEITVAAAAELGLAPGREVLATWKATATRLVAR